MDNWFKDFIILSVIVIIVIIVLVVVFPSDFGSNLMHTLSIYK